mmetsp:Transcript_134293/g.388747  ORF Transcript_134293/g.388747 Transcript_134293/m.388747 type:complete len:104 (+) Transcript_134293:717-1028(+)
MCFERSALSSGSALPTPRVHGRLPRVCAQVHCLRRGVALASQAAPRFGFLVFRGHHAMGLFGPLLVGHVLVGMPPCSEHAGRKMWRMSLALRARSQSKSACSS